MNNKIHPAADAFAQAWANGALSINDLITAFDPGDEALADSHPSVALWMPAGHFKATIDLLISAEKCSVPEEEWSLPRLGNVRTVANVEGVSLGTPQ